MMQLCGRVLLVTFLIYSKFSDAQNHLRGNNNVLVGPEPRIIGGADVNSTSRYPYYAVLAGSDGDMCGGALIAPDIVLTARHCVDFANNVVIGAYTSTFDDAESIQIQQKIFHPLYPDPFNFFAYNIMILKLQHSSASPILKLRRDPVGQGRFTTIGLGAVTTHYGTTTTSQNSVFADKLQEIELGYVDRDQCQEKHGWYISDDMLCASEPMKDACTGDGGSPLLVKGDSYEDDELVGTVSVGRGCADKRFPGIYERTSYFYGWIEKTICRISEDPPDYFVCHSEQPSTSHQPSMTQTPSIAPNTQYPSTATANTDYLNNLGDDSLSPSPSNMNEIFSPSQTNQPSIQPSTSHQPSMSQTPYIAPNTQYPSTATVNKDYLNNLGDDSLSPSPSNMNDTFSPSQTNQPLTQTPAISPSINASFQDTLEDHTSAPLTTVDIIEFVTWDPIEPLQHCQGDCDRDADCAGDMVCFDRAGSPHVPGCVDSSGYVPSISDFCYYEV